MAGEVLGKTYEAMTRLALEMAGVPDEKIFWDQRPKWMSINADFVIGSELDRPEAVILCAHSQASHNSHMKFWRNLEELFETKASLPKPLGAYNLVFDRSYKGQLLAVMSRIFDGHLEIPAKPYGPVLINTGANLAKGPFKGIGADGMLNALKKMCNPKESNYDKGLHQAFAQYAKELGRLLKGLSIELKTLWPLVREEYQRSFTPKKAKVTYVKRGIGKLTLFSVDERQAIYEYVEKGRELPDIPDFAQHLDLFTPTLTGWELQDHEIRNVIGFPGPKTIEEIISKSPLDRMDLFIQPIRHISNLELFHQFVIEHYEEMITPSGMLKYLNECYNAPSSLLPENRASGDLQKVWLFEYLFSVFKSLEKRQQGFGYSSLEQELSIRDPSSIRFWGPAFAAREKYPDLECISDLAGCLSKRLKDCDLSVIRKNHIAIITKEIRTLLEAKLLPYRSFDPVGVLVLRALKKAKINFRLIKAHASCLSEYSGVSAATTKVLLTSQDPPALLKWQSCHGGHVNDKRKELSARATATKFRYNKKLGFSRRHNGPFIFIPDGEWRDADLQVLQKAGWDYVFYSDEMDDLVALLKSLELPKSLEIVIPEEVLPLAAQDDAIPQIRERTSSTNGSRKRS